MSGANGVGTLLAGLSIPASDGVDAPIAVPITVSQGAKTVGSLIAFGISSANAVNDLYGDYLQSKGYLDAYGNPWYDNY